MLAITPNEKSDISITKYIFFQRSGIAIEMTKKTLSVGNFLSSQHDPT